MTKSTKKKHVVTEILESECRVPEEGEKIVRLVCGKGNNLHEVEEVGGSVETFLVSMPSKFRKTVWVKRGDYLFVKPIAEGDKVKGEISEILTKQMINYLKKEGVWPVIESKLEDCDEEDIPSNPNLNRVASVRSDSSGSDGSD